MAENQETNPADDLLSPYIRLTQADRLPHTPRVRLCMEALPRLSTTLPYYIEFFLQREDDDPRHCMIMWDARRDIIIPSNLLLFRHSIGIDGRPELQRVDVGPDPTADRYVWGSCGWYSGSDSGWVELPPGGRSRRMAAYELPERYHKLLVHGEKYELLYPGDEARVWVWGAQEDHRGVKLNLPIVGLRTPDAEAEEELARLVMPGGSRLGFLVETEARPWPGRKAHEASEGFASANVAERHWRWGEAERRLAPSFVKASDRVQGTPILTLTLEGPQELTLLKFRPGSTTFEVQVKLTYEAAASAKPITFRTSYDLWPTSIGQLGRREGYELCRYHKLDEGSDEQEWQVCNGEDDDVVGCYSGLYFEEPDIKVHVRENTEFISLRPGESWTTTYQIQTPTYTALPKDAGVGDRFRYQFLGAANVDWWDWGHIDNEHAETTVILPPFNRGRVVEPANNGGRPKLVVPASNPVEFQVVG